MRWWLLIWLVLSLMSDNVCSRSEEKCKSDSDSEAESGENRPEHGCGRGDGGGNECGNGRGPKRGRPTPHNNQIDSDSDDVRPNKPQKPERDRCCCKFKSRRRNPPNAKSFDKNGPSNVKCCMKNVTNTLEHDDFTKAIKAVQMLEETLEETDLTESLGISESRFVALLHKPKGPFKGLDIYANDGEAMSERVVTNSKVHVQLPKELGAEPNNTIVFCMVSLPQVNETILGSKELLYESRLISLSIRGKAVSSLQERVNITMNLTTSINGTYVPKCVFLNFSTNDFSERGCETHWTHGQSHIICSCDHFTYFGVLMVSADVPPPDLVNLSYITVIGCSISLLALLITVLLFISKRTIRADVSMKVHINLAIALILLNVHLLPSEAVAALRSTGLCFYMALSLHYSLLAAFIWMALEGFHLYLLLVRVFNIYIRKYLLKLSLVGWGVPAVIVSLVVIVDRNVYGPTPVRPSDSNGTHICYIDNWTVKMVTTVGLFSLVFVFNLIMLVVTVRRVLSLRQSKEYGQNDCSRAKRNVCTLLGITILLGTTWGLIFFSFGNLTTAGLYAFCILNPLQGLFIFLWFVMSVRKTGNSTTKTSSETRSSNN